MRFLGVILGGLKLKSMVAPPKYGTLKDSFSSPKIQILSCFWAVDFGRKVVRNIKVENSLKQLISKQIKPSA